MSQVGGTNHPRKIYSIQLHWSRVHWFLHFATDAGSADAGTEEGGSAPCLSSETYENDENINNDGNNSNDDDFPDTNQDQTWKNLFLLQLIYFLATSPLSSWSCLPGNSLPFLADTSNSLFVFLFLSIFTVTVSPLSPWVLL